MKKIHNEIFEVNGSSNFTFCIIGDIHNTKYSKMSTWISIINEVKKVNPDFILIPGDLIYTADDLINSKDKLNYLLIELSKIAPLYISYGNHDYKNGKVLKKEDTFEYFNGLKSERIHILDNECISKDGIGLIGVCPPYNSYYYEYMDKWPINFINTLLEIDLSKVENSEFLILIIHSPEILKSVKKYIDENIDTDDKELLAKLKKAKQILETINIFICAHMHNGLTSRPLEFGRKKNRSYGVVVSEGQKATADEIEHKVKFRIVDFCRGMHDFYNGKIIITRGVTKWCQPNPLFGAIDNGLCSKDINTIKVKK